jgi:hypothetical protein
MKCIKNRRQTENWSFNREVKQLQAKINLTENMTMDMAVFQAQALEVHEKLESVQ